MTTERTGIITFKGNGLTLLGTPAGVGDKAPSFNVLANDLSPRTLGDYKGKVVIISAVPSLDTGVCDMETRRFNQEAANLGEDVKILTVSCDLPFAQARWCGAAGVQAVETLSDHKDLSFGMAYGVVIKELRLLTRAVFVVDRNGTITHAQIVPEVTTEPDYAGAIAAAKKAI
ncbi:thiol peroxidase [Nitratidesulfovibrio vulgaris]|jgi:thiol peroxidase|uniref:Thiol peroxidase n=2 Tax=Nitratidesulfovibrio vulgaris TaxID=881 RepID=Q72CQ5_NITV2|nr:thiol peroxidase [Nitratidesulfovibrio vulgaris]GEB78977.1 putative thiol peroxidase [Desulfovibrio desulfuricans]HBW17230.1 thiol peroxidase [Desulfovibrio sp.]AAS95706.1 thiol peroxidase [Nitratidesulfovibrio vulgaris str. Hildenborough]ABM28849.1 thiol peroxidase (atypical 2-Cys peroxiredoxin) [Nitratidesulfovibrio vulgaris DP4]ADP86293.1 Redoxin domain protein [Nitratidesulfovibrio vulgaris RCH1]